MGNSSIALTFVLFINLILLLWQGAVNDLNPDMNMYGSAGTMYEVYNKGNSTNPVLISDDKSVSNLFPSAQSEVQIGSGNVFTDTYKAIRSWFKTGSSGMMYAKNMLSAPYNAVGSISFLPASFVFLIGTFWYALTIYLIVAFFRGND